jgi:8-oxo-dGTP pyrophosphatase MutT (NUDIX family)
MRRIATAILQLPDGRVALQRRGLDFERSPGQLALFGGHAEEGESAEAAVARELGEETSLAVATLTLTKYLHTTMPDLTQPGEVEYTIFRASIPDEPFEVYEGTGFEVYTIAEALARDDLTRSTRFALTTLEKE